jgi:hypothetical protein
MDQDPQLNDYRRYLLDLLAEQATKSPYENKPGRCQILVNHERVGLLDCASHDPAFVFSSREQVITHLEVRAEDGTMLGALSALECGFKQVHIPVGRHTLELSIHNRLQGGSATATFRSTVSRMGDRAEAPANPPLDMASPDFEDAPARRITRQKAVACAQALLVLAVMALAADRLFGTRSGLPSPETGSVIEHAVSAGRAAVEQIEERLGHLSGSHNAAVEAVRRQQEELDKLRQAVSALGATQQEMKAQLVTARRGKPTRQGTMQRDIDNMVDLLLSRADADQEKLREEIRTVATANDKLAKQLSVLEASNQELKSRLKSAGVDVSKASAVEAAKPAVAQQPLPAGSTQIAEGRRDAQTNPLLFWVAFQEGTTEQSIEQLFKDINGRKGQRSAEWTSVEVDLPNPQTQTAFFESLKKTSIVKAVAMRLESQPTP